MVMRLLIDTSTQEFPSVKATIASGWFLGRNGVRRRQMDGDGEMGMGLKENGRLGGATDLGASRRFEDVCLFSGLN